jgi:hypothetical protein
MYTSHGILEEQLVFHRKIPLETLRIVDVEDDQGSAGLKNMLQIVNSEKSFVVYFGSLFNEHLYPTSNHGFLASQRQLQTGKHRYRP